MKKFITSLKKLFIIILICLACMGSSCPKNSRSIASQIPPQKSIPVEVIPMSQLNGKESNIIVKGKINLVDSKGHTAQIVLISTNSDDTSSKKHPQKTFVISAPEKSVELSSPTNIIAPEPVINVVKQENQKKDGILTVFWKQYKGRIIYYFLASVLMGSGWLAWNFFFNKKDKKIKPKLVQTGNYQSVSTGGSVLSGSSSGPDAGASGASGAGSSGGSGSVSTPKPSAPPKPVGASAGFVPFDLGVGASAAASGPNAGASGANS